MGWEVSDDRIFNHWFKQYGGKRVAILGDCQFGVPGGPASLAQFQDKYQLEQVDTFDVNGEPTHRLDLNQAVPATLHGQYDWVIDAGTAFCCFDPAQVLRNIHNMLAVDGHVFQFASLFGYLNRAYYSFHPILLQDFYQTNGYRDLWLRYRLKGEYWQPMDDINMFNQSNTVPNDTCVLIIAEKTQHLPPKAAMPAIYE